jgi:hypothetical protein
MNGIGRRVEPLEQTVEEAGVSNSRTLVMSMNVSGPDNDPSACIKDGVFYRLFQKKLEEPSIVRADRLA